MSEKPVDLTMYCTVVHKGRAIIRKWTPTPEMIAKWRDEFPTVHITNTLLKAADWTRRHQKNENKLKREKNMPRWIENVWLTNAQGQIEDITHRHKAAHSLSQPEHLRRNMTVKEYDRMQHQIWLNTHAQPTLELPEPRIMQPADRRLLEACKAELAVYVQQDNEEKAARKAVRDPKHCEHDFRHGWCIHCLSPEAPYHLPVMTHVF